MNDERKTSLRSFGATPWQARDGLTIIELLIALLLIGVLWKALASFNILSFNMVKTYLKENQKLYQELKQVDQYEQMGKPLLLEKISTNDHYLRYKSDLGYEGIVIRGLED